MTGAILRPPEGLSGETQFENEPLVMLDVNTKADRTTFENAIRVLLAGQIAEAEFWNGVSSLYRPNVDSHRHDDAEINNLIE